MKSRKASVSLPLRKKSEQREVNASRTREHGQAVVSSPTGRKQKHDTPVEKATAAAMTNMSNPFLQLPQEIHNAIFLHLVDPAYADKFSSVSHAGMHDRSRQNYTRHIQRSTQNLRALVAIASSCKQLQSEFADTVSEYRSSTFHHFRILDAEDFTAFEMFFDKSTSNTLKYQLTPQLKITVPVKFSSLSKILKTLSTIPAQVLESLILELNEPDQILLQGPKEFMLSCTPNVDVLELGFMTCITVTHRSFDGMWTLRYCSTSNLDEVSQRAWIGKHIANSGWIEETKSESHSIAHEKSKVMVREWSRRLSID